MIGYPINRYLWYDLTMPLFLWVICNTGNMKPLDTLDPPLGPLQAATHPDHKGEEHEQIHGTQHVTNHGSCLWVQDFMDSKSQEDRSSSMKTDFTHLVENLQNVAPPHWAALLVTRSAFFLLYHLASRKQTWGRDLALSLVFTSSFIFFYQYAHWSTGRIAPLPTVYTSSFFNWSGSATVSPAQAHTNDRQPFIIDLQEDSEKNQNYVSW